MIYKKHAKLEDNPEEVSSSDDNIAVFWVCNEDKVSRETVKKVIFQLEVHNS